MKKFLGMMAASSISVFLVVLLVGVILGASWGIVALFVWLISLCFGFQFTFLISTGVWLVLLLFSLLFCGKND